MIIEEIRIYIIIKNFLIVHTHISENIRYNGTPLDFDCYQVFSCMYLNNATKFNEMLNAFPFLYNYKNASRILFC